MVFRPVHTLVHTLHSLSYKYRALLTVMVSLYPTGNTQRGSWWKFASQIGSLASAARRILHRSRKALLFFAPYSRSRSRICSTEYREVDGTRGNCTANGNNGPLMKSHRYFAGVPSELCIYDNGTCLRQLFLGRCANKALVKVPFRSTCCSM